MTDQSKSKQDQAKQVVEAGISRADVLASFRKAMILAKPQGPVQ